MVVSSLGFTIPRLRRAPGIRKLRAKANVHRRLTYLSLISGKGSSSLEGRGLLCLSAGVAGSASARPEERQSGGALLVPVGNARQRQLSGRIFNSSGHDFGAVPGKAAARLLGGQLADDVQQVRRRFLGRQEPASGYALLKRLA